MCLPVLSVLLQQIFSPPFFYPCRWILLVWLAPRVSRTELPRCRTAECKDHDPATTAARSPKPPAPTCGTGRDDRGRGLHFGIPQLSAERRIRYTIKEAVSVPIIMTMLRLAQDAPNIL